MKSSNRNIFKYIFAFVVIVLIGGAIYILYYSQNINNEEEEETEEILSTEGTQISIVDNLKMGIQSYDTINPILTKNKEIVNIDKLIFEPLINITSDYHIEYCLAKEITKKDDVTYEIKVDTGIKWQDGSSLISKDIEFTIEKIKQYDSIYHTNVAEIQSVETPDSETAILKLTRPIDFFEYNLDFPIVSSAYYINEDFANSSKIPIGTGMYKIASNDADNIFLARNDRWRYVKKSAPKTQSITIHKYNAVGEIFNSFKLGNTDIINTYMTNYSDYVGTMGYNKKEYVGRYYDFISFNCNDTILSDSNVRRAINHAIDKNSLVSTVFSNSKIASNSPLDYGSYLYNKDGELSYDQDEAKRILQSNDWVFTNNRWQKTIDGHVRKLIISLVVNQDNPERVSVANNIKYQLGEIGIEVNIAKVSTARYNEYLQDKNYQMILTGVTNSINPDLKYFYGENNIANYNNEEVKKCLNTVENFDKLQKKVNEDVPYIGLFRNKITIILNANVGGNFKPTSYFTYYYFNEWYRQV